MKHRIYIALIILIFSISVIGCCNLNRSYVKADIRKYQAVVPDLVDQYNQIQNPQIRKLKLRTVSTWTQRIEEVLKHPDLSSLRKELNYQPIEVPR